ncbi:hypothetical protein D4764_16G0001360 [Takifugu flavidus]|uniref:Uncharacterized protein n=1 Tax=Takifugu flavidus TaxID=433684 RepID=A0A5C6NYA5_9TELE|nr:hypothetical protein D4764_16G0001360 [Takifugu flavidus]
MLYFPGVGSRSQVSLELGALGSSTSDPNRSADDWSTKSARTSTVVTSSNKEDSSPDSNLTLESESSGIFLSSSNQSQEEGGSDSDQPISGSDLGSSNTSLEKDSDDVAGDSDWDSDLSDSDPTRSSRNSASGGKSASTARSKRMPAELGWDEETIEPEVPTELSESQDKARKWSFGVSECASVFACQNQSHCSELKLVPQALNPLETNPPPGLIKKQRAKSSLRVQHRCLFE